MIERRNAGTAGPTEAGPSGGLTTDFVVVPDRTQLGELGRRGSGWLSADKHRQRRDPRRCAAAFNPTARIKGKAIICVHP